MFIPQDWYDSLNTNSLNDSSHMSPFKSENYYSSLQDVLQNLYGYIHHLMEILNIIHVEHL